VGRQVYYEQLNFWLNPVAAVFTVVFSVVFLVLVGSSAGHSHSSALHGGKVIEYYVPGFIAYGVMAACFQMVALTLVVRRETGLLKRLRLSPLPTWVLLSAILVNALIISAVQTLLVLLVGKLAYQVSPPPHLLAFVVTLLIGALSFTALGTAASTLIPNQEAGGPVTGIVFFVLLFLSGLWFPLSGSSGLAKFSSWFPVRRMILAIYAPFASGHGTSAWAWHDIGVIAIWGAAGVLVSARRWSWSPRPSRRGAVRSAVGPSGLLGGRSG
jgi:ABC-2 type transport system permease protein